MSAPGRAQAPIPEHRVVQGASTLSAKPARRFWGWGYLRDGLTADERRGVHKLLASLGPMGPALAQPQVADYALTPSRGKLPDALSAQVSCAPYDRLTHCYGRGFADVARMWMRHALQARMARALELVADHGGRWDRQAVAESMQAPGEQPAAHRSGAAGDWRNAFIRMPYGRDKTTRLEAILDTFDSAITWDRFEAFYEGVRRDVENAIERVTGHASRLSCRFTHVHPDGPAPYFTFVARGSSSGDIASALERWREIKLACDEAVVRHGGAGGALGIQKVLAAPADGHPLLMGTPSDVILTPLALAAVKHRPEQLRLVGLATRAPLALVGKMQLSARSVQELLAGAQRPGTRELSHGSLGAGSLYHLLAEDLSARQKMRMTHVPCKGVAPLVQDLIGGQIDLAFLPAAARHVDHVDVSTPLTYETFARRERGGFMGVASSPQRFEQSWLRPATTIRGLHLTGQDVATDGVIGALVGATLCASVILQRDLMAEIRAQG